MEEILLTIKRLNCYAKRVTSPRWQIAFNKTLLWNWTFSEKHGQSQCQDELSRLYPALVFRVAQIKHHVAYCASATFHFDATGCKIQAISSQKRTLYFSLLAHDSNLPIFEFTSTCHKSVYIRGQLDCFISSVSQFNNGKQAKRQYVVTDCSYAACIRSFNGINMQSYLRYCCRVLTGHVNIPEITSTTILCLCVAHTVKNVCNEEEKVEANIAKRKVIICFFVCLQQANNLQKALDIYKLIYTVLMTEINNTVVEETASAMLRKWHS
jgi:hypothetical protein